MRRKLISERINGLIRPARSLSVLERLFRGFPKEEEWITIKVNAPKYFFLRASVFIEDIYEVTNGKAVMNLRELIILLYDNFLAKIRAGVDMHQHLASLRQTFKQFSDLELSPTSENPNRWVLSNKQNKRDTDRVSMDLSIRKGAAFRGEVFLYDLHHVDPTFSMSVEQLVTLLFLEFIEAIRTGDVEEIMRSVLEFVCKDDYDDDF